MKCCFPCLYLNISFLLEVNIFWELCHFPITSLLWSAVSKLYKFCKLDFSLERESFLGHTCRLQTLMHEHWMDIVKRVCVSQWESYAVAGTKYHEHVRSFLMFSFSDMTTWRRCWTAIKTPWSWRQWSAS